MVGLLREALSAELFGCSYIRAPRAVEHNKCTVHTYVCMYVRMCMLSGLCDHLSRTFVCSSITDVAVRFCDVVRNIETQCYIRPVKDHRVFELDLKFNDAGQHTVGLCQLMN